MVKSYENPNTKKEEILKNAKVLENKYLETISLLKDKNTNEEYYHIYREYLKWLKGRSWKYPYKEYLSKVIHDDTLFSLYTPKDIDMRGHIMHFIYEITMEILIFIDAYQFNYPVNRPSYHLYAWEWGIAKTREVEIGEEVELSVFMQFERYYGKIYHKTIDRGFYQFESKINQGAIQEIKGRQTFGVFEVEIPTQKIGKQSFELEIRAKNQNINVDTTLLYSNTFEVTQ